MKLYRNWGLLLIALVLVIFYLLKNEDDDMNAPNYKNCIEHKYLHFHGFIDSVYFDSDNRYKYTAKILTDSSVYNYTFLCIWNPENYFKKGDSVRKLSGNHFLSIYNGRNWEEISCHDNFSCDKWKNMKMF